MGDFESETAVLVSLINKPFLVIFLSGPIGPDPPNFSGPDKETAGPVCYTVLCSQIVVFYSGYYVKKLKTIILLAYPIQI